MSLAITRLSVNLNKIALLRNARHTGVPDLLHFADLAHEAGAGGLTIHPRPDERHIRRSDVEPLAARISAWRPAFELNVEGYPDDQWLELVCRVRPEQCTLVPDPPNAFTSESGWQLDESQIAFVRRAVDVVRSIGSRPIVFVDPDPSVIARVPATGAAGVEIYTGSYAAAARHGSASEILQACANTAHAASAAGLVVNIGHDLNLENLSALLAATPPIAEASIGHELTADALVMGFVPAVAAYKRALSGYS